MSASAKAPEPLFIAMIGTRGVPAEYGGFETAIEEVGRRLVDRGHRVRVYSRGEPSPLEYLGMERIRLPALRRKQLETLSHTGLSVLHSMRADRPDMAFVFNAANSPFLPFLRARSIPTALHMDGLEWKRAKWGPVGQRYYRWAEEFGVRWADALIADAPGIGDYYRDAFGVPTELIRYGAKLIEEAPAEGVRALGLTPGQYHLVVARFEPENHVLEIVEGFHRSASTQPLVIVGSAPYAVEYTRRIGEIAASDDRIRLVGAVWDQELLDALYFHAFTYLHGHSVGGTNPSLLRAIGAGTGVIAYDVDFNREVLAGHGLYFSDAADVCVALELAEGLPDQVGVDGAALRDRARRDFRWDSVAVAYEDLAVRLVAGQSVHAQARKASRTTGPRRRS
jgi:glycosyltransferase involved in cell wall biosynthesis